ncbi:MAG TPA: hypothetical protein EYP56_07770, partial [Planctomycetaceae bacterium]|nr:hypothetical protein [Planctomycetaceae bacterium]
MTDVMSTAKKIIANVERVIVGKRRQIVLSLVAWFCEGHILLEDVPGVAKTMLARALARSSRLARSAACSAALTSSALTSSPRSQARSWR